MKSELSVCRAAIRCLFWPAILFGCALPSSVAAATLDTHTVVLDDQSLIVPWTSNPSDGYDRVMFLSWDLLLSRVPIDPENGLSVPYTHSEYDPTNLVGSGWPNNPAGKNAMLADAAIQYYAYSGNHAVIDLVSNLLRHELEFGTTPTNYAWSSVPWSTAAAGSITYGNDTLREGAGVVEPDKLGEVGTHGYLRFYELTGDTNYLHAAISCADALAQHVRNGDGTHAPWPFRVLAQTGATAQQEEYCADVVGPIRLFDELLRLGLGNTNAYHTARQTAWNWLMTYPMSNRVWANYFEDVPPRPNDLSNLNQYCPGETARYLLEHPEMDTNWFGHVTNLLGFIETTFGGTDSGAPGLQYGARVISEQVLYQFKMASHTSRFASDYALLYSLTGDTTARDKAYRSLNWCTYMCRTNDVVIEGPEEYAFDPGCWFTDGHGDYIRHFMVALGAVPEWAPAGQNHITHSTTVIKAVVYAPTSNSIAYTTFDSASTETLRIAFTPVDVFVDGVRLAQRADMNQPGWVFTPSNGVLRIRHDAGTSVQVVAGVPGNQPPTVSLTSPPAGRWYAGPASIPLSAVASDSDGSVVQVDFYSGNTLIGAATNPPFNAVWTGVGSGAYTVLACATDNNGAVTVSQPVSITVIDWTATTGNTNEGTLTESLWNTGAWIHAARVQAKTTLTVTSLLAKVTAIAGNYRCAVYTDTNTQPNRFLRETAELASPGSGWQTFRLTSPLILTNAQYYWLAIWSGDTNARVYYSDTTGTSRRGRFTYGAWPDPITTTAGTNLNDCIYAIGLPDQLTNVPPVLTITNLGNGSYQIRTSGIPGKTYRFDYLDSLVGLPWLGLGSSTADDFAVVTYTDQPSPASPARFYRMVYP